MKQNFVVRHLAICFTFVLGLTLPARALPLQPVTTVNAAVTPSTGGGGDSWHPIITPDGRYVLFASRANNLVLSGTNNPFLNQVPPKMNVFLRDRDNETTTLVSVNYSGTGPGNGDSTPTALSTNGQFALFESTASDILPGDTNNATDIFLRDLVHGTNQLISVSTNRGFGRYGAWESVMTPDGRYVAFASASPNLVRNDTNSGRDIFVRDTRTGVTTLASPDATFSASDSPMITPDGRYVAFRSMSTANEIYVRDLVAGTTTLASANAHNLFTGVTNSYNQVISDDGQFVVFESGTNDTGVIQRYSLKTGLTDVIYTNAVGTYSCNHFRSVDMSSDGRRVAFVGNTDTSGTTSCVFVWDAQSGVATLVNTNLAGVVPTNSVSDCPTIDSTGRWLTYFCTATNLTTNVLAGDFHLYVQDLQAGTITLVDAGTNGAGLTKDLLSAPRLTPDGHFIAFDSTDADLVANDNNCAYDVFVNDLTADTNEMISVRHPTLPEHTSSGASVGSVFSISATGHYLAFSEKADGLLPAGYTNAYRGVFVRDQFSGTNILVSVDTNGFGGADGWSFEPSISGDGRYVAFTSGADNLVAGDTNSAQDVFVRDLQNGITTLVSMNAGGTGPGNAASYSPMISSGGRYVLFRSLAKNLTSGTFDGRENIFLRDLQLATNYAVTTSPYYGQTLSTATMTPDARFVAYGCNPINASIGFVVWDLQRASSIYTNTTSRWVSAISISPDGNRIVYSSANTFTYGFYGMDRAANSNWLFTASNVVLHAGLQFTADSRFLVYATTGVQTANDTNRVSDVYLYDFQTHSNFLISKSYLKPGAANGASDSPTISADGRFIVYCSSASDIVPGATNGVPNVYMFDRQTGATTLVSASLFGAAAANNRSLAPVFSGDGRTLVFFSWASDLAAGDYNQSSDLFAYAFLYAGIAASNNGNPTISWPVSPGQTYSVEYKDNLNDATWQPVSGSVSISGNRGSLTDAALTSGHRFYRIVSSN